MEAILSSTNICKPSLCHFLANPPRKWLLVNNRSVLNAKQGEREEKPVNKNSMTLRMRIKKTKKSETFKDMSQDDHHPSSEDWMKRDGKLLENYHDSFHEAIRVLKTLLVSTKPSVVLGILSLVVMSIPISSSPTIVANAIKIIRGVLAGCHISIDIDF